MGTDAGPNWDFREMIVLNGADSGKAPAGGGYASGANRGWPGHYEYEQENENEYEMGVGDAM
jgi:hypothetical protein